MKIPFAYSAVQGRVVEVSSVPSGRRCGCFCPSCRQAVVAKKGAVNQWHFSHDPAPSSGPVEECEISFLVSCRQFIIDAALAGDLPEITTPPVVFYGKQYRAGTALSGVNWHKGISNFDLSATIGRFHLHLYLSYPGRESPVLPEDRKGAAFLEIDLQPIQQAIDHQLRDGRNIIEQAHDLFKSGGGLLIIGPEPYFPCSWIYHHLEEHDDVRAARQHQIKLKEREAIRYEDLRLMPDGPGKDLRRQWIGGGVYGDLGSAGDISPPEKLEISVRETRYPRGYQGLTNAEKALVDKYPKSFSKLAEKFQGEGLGEEESCVKAAIELMVRLRTGKMG